MEINALNKKIEEGKSSKQTVDKQAKALGLLLGLLKLQELDLQRVDRMAESKSSNDLELVELKMREMKQEIMQELVAVMPGLFNLESKLAALRQEFKDALTV